LYYTKFSQVKQTFEVVQYDGYGHTSLWHTDYFRKWKWAGSCETRYGQWKAKSRVRVSPWRLATVFAGKLL